MKMNAVIYARYSSSSQREESIEGQLRECKAYADKNNLNIVGTYIDRARSARTDNRPDFQRMIDDINQKAMKKQEKIDTKIQKRRNKIDKAGIAEDQIWQY